MIFAISMTGYFVSPPPYKAFLAGFAERVRKQLPVIQLEEWARNEMREVRKTNNEGLHKISPERLPQFIRDFASPQVPTTVMWRNDSDLGEALSINFGGHYMNWGIIVFAQSNHVLNSGYEYKVVGTDTYAFHD